MLRRSPRTGAAAHARPLIRLCGEALTQQLVKELGRAPTVAEFDERVDQFREMFSIRTRGQRGTERPIAELLVVVFPDPSWIAPVIDIATARARRST